MTGTKYPLEGGRLIFSGTAKFGLLFVNTLCPGKLLAGFKCDEY